MACFCKLMAQNWHKNFALVRACSGFTWRVSDCEELVGEVNHTTECVTDLYKNYFSDFINREV